MAADSIPTPAAGLYIHVPFCSAICPYCDFAVVKRRGHDLPRFVERLGREMAAHADQGWRFDTVYFGGGTPSALSPGLLRVILDRVADTFAVAADSTIHFEANPEDLSPEVLHAWRELGVSFLSLGVQSFDDQRLRRLGRRHRRQDAERAVAAAVATGFETVNVDVIYALPGERPGEALADFERAIELGAQHLSGYELTIHEGTPFARWRDRGGLVELDEDLQAELLLSTHARLGKLGFEGYEVSNFARHPIHRSAHNQKYWRHVPYLGVGPSAHSFDGRRRWWNLRSLDQWAAAVDAGVAPLAGEEQLSAPDLLLETLMLGLRTAAGVDLEALERATELEIPRHSAVLDQARAANQLQLNRDQLRPTVRGMALADRLALEIARTVG